MQRKWYKYHYLKTLSKVEAIVALTNGDANEWYLDAYKKFENRVIKVPADVREQ